MTPSDQEKNDARLLVGLRLRDVRVQYGFSLEQFAERVGMSLSHLSNIECGRKAPPLDLLIRVAEEFDISLDYLVLGKTDRARGGFLIFRSDEELLRTVVIVPRGTRNGPPHA